MVGRWGGGRVVVCVVGVGMVWAGGRWWKVGWLVGEVCVCGGWAGYGVVVGSAGWGGCGGCGGCGGVGGRGGVVVGGILRWISTVVFSIFEFILSLTTCWWPEAE